MDGEVGLSVGGKGAAADFRLRDYVAIARPDHWFKNVFMLPGAALAWVLMEPQPVAEVLGLLVLAAISTCLIASANYTINEWLDAETDRHHPVKCHRPSAAGRVRQPWVAVQWAGLALAGLGIAATLSTVFFAAALLLLLMGLVYNVPPVRTKDLAYFDVLSESINNPIRFVLGWAALIGDVLPPSSILLAYWLAGAFLMAVKRYAEFREIGPEVAGRYRRSFRFYSEETLLTSSVFYALTAAFFLGVFLVKYRIEFLISMPFLALLFAWYLALGQRIPSPAQAPEKLYQETAFVAYVGFVAGLIAALFFIDLPWLATLMEPRLISLG